MEQPHTSQAPFNTSSIRLFKTVNTCGLPLFIPFQIPVALGASGRFIKT